MRASESLLVGALRRLGGFLKDGVGDIDVKLHVEHAHHDVAVGDVIDVDLNGTITPSTLR